MTSSDSTSTVIDNFSYSHGIDPPSIFALDCKGFYSSQPDAIPRPVLRRTILAELHGAAFRHSRVLTDPSHGA